MNRILLFAALAALFSCGTCPPPEPFGVCPTPAQVNWQRQELIMFYHFGQATFSGADGANALCQGKPWSEELLVENYQPEGLDPAQWVSVAAENGFKEVILTAKHHDGFCLWDNPESTADVAHPLCRNQLDIVAALRHACDSLGIQLGIYLSPWDRTIEAAGLDTGTYEQMYLRAVKDLMRRYAPVNEFWIDGNHAAAFDWPAVHRAVLEENPDCIIFSDAGPGCRWVGNERGQAGETNWSTLNAAERGLAPGQAPGDYASYLASGDCGGSAWIPAECDFSIQDISDPDGWFYDPTDRVKSGRELMDIYYASVGRNGVFLMNVPPSRQGRLADAEVAAIREFTRIREAVFRENLARGAKLSASAVRGRRFGPERLLDGNYDSYYAAPDGVTDLTLEIELDGEKTFNRLLLQEYIPLGQRVAAFSVSYRSPQGLWLPWAEATTIGHKRILLGPQVTTDALRIQITHSLAPPLLNTLGLYLDPQPTAK